MGHRLLASFALVLVVAGVYGTPHGGLPSVGSVWGPVHIHDGFMRTTDGQILYIYSKTDVIQHNISDFEFSMIVQKWMSTCGPRHPMTLFFLK